MKKSSPNPTLMRFFTLGACAVLFAGVLALGDHSSSTERAFEHAASKIIATCAKSPYAADCYDKEIPKLSATGLSMEEMFLVTKIIQNKTGSYWYCHVLGHELGSREVAKDPAEWTGVVTRCPVNMCSNGCIHGAFQERFRKDKLEGRALDALVDELSTVCTGTKDRLFTGVERGSCYHALGHLMVYATDADIPKALGMCDRAVLPNDSDTRKNMGILCYHGVFMQLFQPLDLSDAALVKKLAPVGPGEVRAYCGAFGPDRKDACIGESWPLFVEQFASKKGIDDFCSYAETPIAAYRCYEGIFYILASQFQLDEGKIATMCDGFDLDLRGQCYGNAASRFLDTDAKLIPRAARLCARAAEAGAEERCYQELLFDSIYDFGKDSPDFTKLCNALPEPWRGRCLGGEGATTRIHP